MLAGNCHKLPAKCHTERVLIVALRRSCEPGEPENLTWNTLHALDKLCFRARSRTFIWKSIPKSLSLLSPVDPCRGTKRKSSVKLAQLSAVSCQLSAVSFDEEDEEGRDKKNEGGRQTNPQSNRIDLNFKINPRLKSHVFVLDGRSRGHARTHPLQDLAFHNAVLSGSAFHVGPPRQVDDLENFFTGLALAFRSPRNSVPYSVQSQASDDVLRMAKAGR